MTRFIRISVNGKVPFIARCLRCKETIVSDIGYHHFLVLLAEHAAGHDRK